MPAIAALDGPHPNQAVTQHNFDIFHPFLRLPVELRVMVYEFVAQVNGPIRPQQVAKGSNKFAWDKRTKIETRNSDIYVSLEKPTPIQNLTITNLARASWLVHDELEDNPVFYRVNSFLFSGLWQLHHFLAAITPARRGYIRHITVKDQIRFSYDETPFTSRYANVLPLLQQCHDIRHIVLRIKEKESYQDELLDSPVVHVASQLSRLLRCLEIVLNYHLVPYNRQPQDTSSNDSGVTIGPKWDGTELQGDLAELVRFGLGAEIAEIGKFMASKMKFLARNPIEFTEEQLKKCIAAAGIHFPGEDRVHQNVLASNIGTVSSRTRQRRNKASFNVSRGRVERPTGRYDSEGLLTDPFYIVDIRLVDSDIECEVRFDNGNKSWEPLHAVSTNEGIRYLGNLYRAKLRLAARDWQVMQGLPSPRDITTVTDGYRKMAEEKPRPEIWEAYRRMWTSLQNRYDAYMKKWARDSKAQKGKQQEQDKARKKTGRGNK
ncbi:hypothetical protein PG995_000683 [Apiospora arundinis]